MIHITHEAQNDWWDVEQLFDTCFSPGRGNLSSYRFRENSAPIQHLCLVARDDDQAIIGAIRYWPIQIHGNGDTLPPWDALLLGPVAIHPVRQGEGLGGLIIQQSLNLARDHNNTRVLLIGDLNYYEKFGFNILGDVEMPPPTNPKRVLGRELVAGAWNGVHGRVIAAPAKDDRL